MAENDTEKQDEQGTEASVSTSENDAAPAQEKPAAEISKSETSKSEVSAPQEQARAPQEQQKAAPEKKAAEEVDVLNDGASGLSKENSFTTLKEEIDIFIDQPLEKYNQGLIKAYRAAPKNGGSDSYFALVCEKFIIPRREVLGTYTSMINPGIAYLIDHGVVYWPPEKSERFILVYRDSLGDPLLKPGQKAALGWKPEYVVDTVVKPMIGVLQDFRDKDFTHGAIRVSNFFDSGSEKMERVTLGDCLAAPASSMQPALYEPAHRAMASPLGRGKGTVADDLYAFGVALAVMLRSADPLEGKDEAEVIRAKMEHGTFSAIISQDRFQGSILDLLRGLLQDDVSMRWTIDEVLLWSEGNRPNSKRAARERKAPRPIVFNDKKYFYASYLAMDLQDNAPDVVRCVDDESLEQWVSRALENEEMMQRVDAAITSSRSLGTGPGYPERLASNLSTALDVKAPIRFYNLKVHGEGIGNALATAMARKQDVQNYVKIFTQNIAMNWLTAQAGNQVDVGALISRFDTVRGFLKQTRIGYGVEKALYTLCPGAPCMSEKLKGYYVDSPEAFMNAFEDICEKGAAPALFLDRHSAAFLHTKDSKDVEVYLTDLNATELHRRLVGNIGVMGSVQRRSNMGNFPALAETFMKMLDPVFERYHDRETRDNLKREIQKYAAAGSLSKMSDVLDNVQMMNRDYKAFKEAMEEYRALSQEYITLEERLKNKETFGRGTGKEVAAIVSVILAGIFIIGALFMQFG